MTVGQVAAREDVRFPSGGETLAGWLYRPEDAEGDAPCVVMAHGFGALKEARLDAYAERFAAAGFAVLVFDYRHFGESTGEPRNLIDVRRQHADWRAAIGHARALDGVDPDRIALWGSSFSGGHVIAVGAADPRIAAIVAQVPHASGLGTLQAAGPRNVLRLTVAGLRDAARALRGRDPYYAPIVGRPGTLAAMNSPDALPGYSAMYPEGFDWRNRYAARVGLTARRLLARATGRRRPLPADGRRRHPRRRDAAGARPQGGSAGATRRARRLRRGALRRLPRRALRARGRRPASVPVQARPLTGGPCASCT